MDDWHNGLIIEFGVRFENDLEFFEEIDFFEGHVFVLRHFEDTVLLVLMRDCQGVFDNVDFAEASFV